MDKRRFGALVGVAAVSVVAALLSAGISGPASAGSTATSQDKPPINCGSDRWDVKTLSPNDPFVGKIAKKVVRTTFVSGNRSKLRKFVCQSGAATG